MGKKPSLTKMYGSPYIFGDIDSVDYQFKANTLDAVQKSKQELEKQCKNIVDELKTGQLKQDQSSERFVEAIEDSIKSASYRQSQDIADLKRQQQQDNESLKENQTENADRMIEQLNKSTKMNIDAEAHFTGNIIGSRPDEPSQLSQLNLSKQELIALIMSSARHLNDPQIASQFSEEELKVLTGETTLNDKKTIEEKLSAIEEKKSGAYQGLNQQLDNYSETIKSYNTEKSIKKKNSIMLSKAEKDNEIYEKRAKFNLMTKEEQTLRNSLNALNELPPLLNKMQGKDLPTLVKEGSISTNTAEKIVRYQQIPAEMADQLYEAHLIHGPLGGLKRINIVNEENLASNFRQENILNKSYQQDTKRNELLGGIGSSMIRQETILANTFQQNERRDMILTHVKDNLSDIDINISRQTDLIEEQNRYLGDMSDELSVQTGYLEGISDELSVQTGYLEEQNHRLGIIGSAINYQTTVLDNMNLHIMDQNLILHEFATNMVEKFDLVHLDLNKIDFAIQKMGTVMEHYLQNACLGINFMNQKLSQIHEELIINRLYVMQKIDNLTQALTQGIEIVHLDLKNIQTILLKIFDTMSSPKETASKEALSNAISSIKNNDIEGAIEILEATNPYSHRFAEVHLLLGSCYYYNNQPEKAVFPLTKALQHGDAGIKDQSASLLSQITLSSGDPILAKKILEDIVMDENLNLEISKSLVNYGKFLFSENNMPEAIHYFVVALKNDPTSISTIIPFLSAEKKEKIKITNELKNKFDEIIKEDYSFPPKTF